MPAMAEEGTAEGGGRRAVAGGAARRRRRWPEEQRGGGGRSGGRRRGRWRRPQRREAARRRAWRASAAEGGGAVDGVGGAVEGVRGGRWHGGGGARRRIGKNESIGAVVAITVRNAFSTGCSKQPVLKGLLYRLFRTTGAKGSFGPRQNFAREADPFSTGCI